MMMHPGENAVEMWNTDAKDHPDFRTDTDGPSDADKKVGLVGDLDLLLEKSDTVNDT